MAKDCIDRTPTAAEKGTILKLNSNNTIALQRSWQNPIGLTEREDALNQLIDRERERERWRIKIVFLTELPPSFITTIS